MHLLGTSEYFKPAPNYNTRKDKKDKKRQEKDKGTFRLTYS